MRPLRVLHVIESMTRGGAETMVVEHVRHRAPGSRAIVCALNHGGPALELAERWGARTVLLGKAEQRLDGIHRLADLARAERVDVVNGHNPTGALYATAAATLAGVPAIVRTEHSIHYEGRHSSLYAPVLEPLLTARTGAVVCVCEAVRASHARRMRWADTRFVTIDNGVSDDPAIRSRAAVRAELGIGDGERLVLTIGSLTSQKAHDVLLDAFAAVARDVPMARLAIVGAGPLAAPLHAQLGRLGLAGAALLGARQDVADLMAAADLFVLSSVREGLAITLLEAMRAGRAAVVTDVGGNADGTQDGVTGVVVPPRDPAAMARAIASMLSTPGVLETMGVAARRRWELRYRAERMVRATEAVYERLLGARLWREATAADAARPPLPFERPAEEGFDDARPARRGGAGR